MNSTALIAIDWGTTSARAYALDSGGEVLGERSAPLGIAQIEPNGFPAAFATLLGEWMSLPVPRIACGMIGSRQGWIEAPYLQCPAALDALANGLCFTPGGEMAIVPGVICADGAAVPDVMRGEETQILGATEDSDSEQVVVLPGTHSKWACVERGRITNFATWMTGELFSVLLQHSLLGRLATPHATTDGRYGQAFEQGVRRGLDVPGLSHAIFGARTLVLTDRLEPEGVADWLSGVLVGHEIASASERFGDAIAVTPRLQIVGSNALTERYVHALAMAGVGTTTARADAAPRGLFRIALQAKLVR